MLRFLFNPFFEIPYGAILFEPGTYQGLPSMVIIPETARIALSFLKKMTIDY
jgi:hypothetical protein